MAAWRGLDGFRARASLRARRYRIALRAITRRPPAPPRMAEPLSLQPCPDALVADHAPGPDARYEPRESIALAFVAGLAHLPPRQRAALVLRDVLGFRAPEVAEILDTTDASVDRALQRARAALEEHLPPGSRERAPLPHSAQERAVVERFAGAFGAGDVDGIVALLTNDAWLTMPPAPFEYQGPAAIRAFLSIPTKRGLLARVRLVPTRANGQPAFGCYLRDLHGPVAHAHGLLVLTLEGDRIAAITRFLDSSAFPLFGLPRTLPD